MNETPVRILGVLGSLRKGSYNRMALKNAKELLPEGTILEEFYLDSIPPFNQDLENSAPVEVAKLKGAIRAADAVLIVTPEYNYSIPGVLKNAIDWASRPPGDNSWVGKPVAVMGASPGMLGTARGQYHLRQVFLNLKVVPVTAPEVFISSAHKKFDGDGKLTDTDTRAAIAKLLAALVSLARERKAAVASAA